MITRTTLKGGSYIEYTYDPLNRLTSETKKTPPESYYSERTIYRYEYTFDAVGNRLNMRKSFNFLKPAIFTEYLYNEENQLTSSEENIEFKDTFSRLKTVTYSYDNNGNLIRKTVMPTNPSYIEELSTEYSYDYENRLNTITYPDNTSSQYQYDGTGKRIRTAENNKTTQYLYDGLNVIIERDDTHKTTATYTRGLGIGGGIGSIISSTREKSKPSHSYWSRPSTSYYHYDGLGNVTSLTSNRGYKIAGYTYDAYGNTLRQTGVGFTNKYKYSSKEYSPKSGLVYFGARYYDPTIGRFTQPDTIVPSPGDPQAFNRYSYARNNPIRYTDPTGHFSFKDLWGQIIGAICGVIANMILPGSGVIVYSAVSAAITASMNGASFGEALGYGAISGFAAFAGMQFGSALGGALGLGEFSTGVLAGVAGGAAGGATGAALMGGDVGRATLAGMAGGGIGMAIPYAGAIIGGGVAAEIAGGEFWEGAAGGAAYVVASAITSGAFQAARDVGAKLNKERFASQHKVDQEIVRHALKPPSLTESAEEFNEIVGNLTDTIPHGTTTGNPAADTALKAYSILKSLPKLANKMKSALTTAQDKFISFLNRVGTVGTTKAEQFSKDPNNISDIAIYAPYVSGPIIKHK